MKKARTRVSEGIDDSLEAINLKKLMRLAPNIDKAKALEFIRSLASASKPAAAARAEREFVSNLAKLPPEDATRAASPGAGENDVTSRWPAEFERRRGRASAPISAPAAKSSPSGSTSVPPPAASAVRQKADKSVYKIYGKKGGKPVHTRLKGRAYIPGGDETSFKPGMQASLSASDGDSINVKDPSSDHTQSWVGVDEGLKRLIRAMVTEAIADLD